MFFSLIIFIDKIIITTKMISHKIITNKNNEQIEYQEIKIDHCSTMYVAIKKNMYGKIISQHSICKKNNIVTFLSETIYQNGMLLYQKEEHFKPISNGGRVRHKDLGPAVLLKTKDNMVMEFWDNGKLVIIYDKKYHKLLTPLDSEGKFFKDISIHNLVIV